jgi:flagellin-like protein
MMCINKNDEAVSPVIGVILCVAITVILAAVVASLVFGMSGNLKGDHTVGLKAEKVTTALITVSVTDSINTDDVESLTATAYQDDGSTVTASVDPVAGSVTEITGTFTMYHKNRVVVSGKFADNTEQILLDTMV